MMEKESQIIAKIVVEKQLSEEQKSILREWLSANDQSVRTLDEIFSGETVRDILELKKSDVVQRMVLNLRKRKRRRLLRIRLAAAVSVAAVCIFSFFALDNREQVIVKPSFDGAIKLVTMSGEEINLEDTTAQIAGASNSKKTLSFTPDGNKQDTLKIIVPTQKEYNLVLADGTKVWINSESELRFSSSMSGAVREVYLVGEAFFDVKKDPSRPFIVKTKALNTKVTGTQFMVSSYRDNDLYKVSLVEGGVEVKSNSNDDSITLTPGYGVEYDTKTAKYDRVKINVNEVLAQKSSHFIYNEISLEEICRELKRWYGVEFAFEDESLKNLIFYLNTPKRKNLVEVLNLLKRTKEIDYTIENNRVLIKNRF
ncbi:MAG: FecR family protein [Rikenellaceae bacterium]